MVRIRQVTLGVGLACLVLLGGCKSLFGGGNSCNKQQVYEEATALPALQVPAGLDGMDTRGALKIPELREPPVPRTPDSPCLDKPPVLVMPPPAAPPAR
jgi:uncharacterized lipoprotein